MESKDTLYLLESSLVSWTDIIKAVLTAKPEEVLIEDETAGALQQIDFWSSKAKNLAFLIEQFQAPKVQKILNILRKVTDTSRQAMHQTTTMCVSPGFAFIY